MQLGELRQERLGLVDALRLLHPQLALLLVEADAAPDLLARVARQLAEESVERRRRRRQINVVAAPLAPDDLASLERRKHQLVRERVRDELVPPFRGQPRPERGFDRGLEPGPAQDAVVLGTGVIVLVLPGRIEVGAPNWNRT